MKEKKTVSVSSTSFICMLLVLILYYYSYRYIFKYANSHTSGTYFDTPVMIQAAKYLICAVILAGFCLYGISGRHRWTEKRNTVFALFILLAHSVYAFIWLRNKDSMVLCMGIAVTVCIAAFAKEIRFRSIDRVFFVFFVYCSAYEWIQLFLYVTKGRLPAIAWGNVALYYVRFGGAFDEPFAFSIFLSFLIPYVYNKYSGIRRYVLTAMLFFFLVMTWTMTTAAAVTGVYGLAAAYSLLRNKVKAKEAFSVMLVALFFVIWGMFYGAEFMGRLLAAKAGSINSHIASFDFHALRAVNFFGMIPQAKYSESSMVKMLYSNGFLFVILFYAFGFFCTVRFRKHMIAANQDSRYLPLYKGMYYYQICFLVSSLNIPYIYSFFSMFLYSVFLGVMLAADGEHRRSLRGS